MQVFNLLLPLITFPYLIRVLGKETYGLVIYAQAIISYLSIFINFGFNISATKDIAINKENYEVISKIVSSVFLIKIFLFGISIFVFSAIIYIIPNLRLNSDLYLLTMGYCIYETLFPVWYFQGKEEMKYITYINVLSRGTFTILIFLLVKNRSDYLLVPILNTLGALIAGLSSIYLIFFKEKIKFSIPHINLLYQFVKDSAPFFFSRATGMIIAKSNTVLIGSFIGFTQVAYYDLAVKISELCKVPSNLINQTIYPRVSITKDMNFVIKVIKYNLILSVILYLSIIIFNGTIISILGGTQMQPAKYIIIVLNITAPLAGISYFLGNTMLVVNGFYKPFNKSVIYEALLYILLAVLLIFFKIYNLYTFACIVILSYSFEIIYRYYHIKKNRII